MSQHVAQNAAKLLWRSSQWSGLNAYMTAAAASWAGRSCVSTSAASMQLLKARILHSTAWRGGRTAYWHHSLQQHSTAQTCSMHAQTTAVNSMNFCPGIFRRSAATLTPGRLWTRLKTLQNPTKFFCSQSNATPTVNQTKAAAAQLPPAAAAAAAKPPPTAALRSQVSQAGQTVQQAVVAGRTAVRQLPSQAARLVPGSVWGVVDTVRRPGRWNAVLSLQLEALWKSYGNVAIFAVMCLAAYLLWKFMYGVTSAFVNLSSSMAEYGFMALAFTIVVLSALYVRNQLAIHPVTVYRLAMLRLNSSPAVLEVVGAPLVGSDLRAYIVTGGGLRFQGLRPKYRSRRVQMIFPVRGTERRGLVSLEAKRRQGKYKFKLLAVDVPSAAAGDERIFLEGDQSVYDRGTVMSELRDPFLRALSLQRDYDHEDEDDDAEDERARERVARAAKVKRAATAPKPIDNGGGMYFYERVYWTAHRGWDRVRGMYRKWQMRQLAD